MYRVCVHLCILYVKPVSICCTFGMYSPVPFSPVNYPSPASANSNIYRILNERKKCKTREHENEYACDDSTRNSYDVICLDFPREIWRDARRKANSFETFRVRLRAGSNDKILNLIIFARDFALLSFALYEQSRNITGYNEHRGVARGGGGSRGSDDPFFGPTDIACGNVGA